MSEIHAFKIDVPNSALERLHQKLELANFPEEIEDAGWEYGAAL